MIPDMIQQHQPHTIQLVLPGLDEAPHHYSFAVCEHGTCTFPISKVIARWEAVGIKAISVPGVHWWSDDPSYQRPVLMAFLHRAKCVGDSAAVAHYTEQLRILAGK